jgi:hypothetical protein
MNVAENLSYVASVIFTTAAITSIQTGFSERSFLPDANVSYPAGEVLEPTFVRPSLSQYESIGFRGNKEEVILAFALKMLHQTQDLEPMFAEMIEERFWDLL